MLRKVRTTLLGMIAGLGSMAFQSCPFNGMVTDCFGEDTISASDFEDLNGFEQVLYQENDCGRYEPRSGLIGDLL